MKNLRMFRKLCGDEGLGSVACVTTMWSLCSPEDGECRERQLLQQNDLWKYLLDHGARSFRHDAGKKSAEAILKYLVQRRRNVTLDIQEEMVNKGLKLSQTAAGKEVQGDLDKLKDQHQQELKEIRSEMEEAIREKDKERQKDLEEYRAQIQQQMAKQEEEMRRLQSSREELRREKQEKHEQELSAMRNQRSSSGDSYGYRFPVVYYVHPAYYYETYRGRSSSCVIL